MYRVLLGLAASLVFTASPVSAQSAFSSSATTPVAGQRIATWKCVLPGGTFEVALRSVTTISSHEYVIEGGIKITEVVIETSSSSTENRFYYMQAPGQNAGGVAGSAVDAVQSRAQAAADHVTAVMGGNTTASDLLNTTVVKSYPTTTHAHTVEYRMASLADLTSLFNSIEAAWTSNTNTSFAPTTTTGGSTGGGTAGQ